VAMADGFSRASGKSYASRRAMAPHNASQPKCLHWPMSAPPRSGDPKSIIYANDRFAPKPALPQVRLSTQNRLSTIVVPVHLSRGFLASALAKVDPALVHNLHMVQSVLALPDHLAVCGAR